MSPDNCLHFTLACTCLHAASIVTKLPTNTHCCATFSFTPAFPKGGCALPRTSSAIRGLLPARGPHAHGGEPSCCRGGSCARPWSPRAWG